MTNEEKKKRYEKLREELWEITFIHSVEEYDPERVTEIVEEMEVLDPVSENEYPDQEKILRFIFSHN